VLAVCLLNRHPLCLVCTLLTWPVPFVCAFVLLARLTCTCFFLTSFAFQPSRPVADQLGEPDKHASFRSSVCDYMLEHPDDFAPFYDGGNGTYEAYVSGMRRDGRWAGNLEVRCTRSVCDVPLRWSFLRAPRPL